MKKYDLTDFINVTTIDSTLSELTARIKARRKERKWTQKDLAIRSGVTYSSIRRFEETGDISLASLLKISNALDSLDDFKHLFSTKFITNLKDYRP